MLVKDLIGRRSWLAKSAWIQMIERPNVEQAAAVHLTSQLEAEELQRFGWRSARLAVIPNGVDGPPMLCDDRIGADVECVAAEQPLVLFLGRISWKKGLDRLLRGFAASRSGKLAIVGTDDEGLAPQLMKLSRSLGIADRVHILPRTIIGSEKEHLFAAARVFVLTSYSENFGNTVLEAMRRRVPVIVTPEVGAAEIVQESGGGLVVTGDPIPLGHAICQLTSDADLAQSMGEAGQRHAMAHYSWTSIAERMEGLYESLI
jgi:glycosyltransferase involved in cell wall biosynthesis